MKKWILAITLTLASATASAAQDEVVSGFRSFAWGTPVAAIPEIAGTQSVGEKDGLAIYSAQVTVSGRRALAGYYFHPSTGGLVEGAYVFALTQEDCLPVWATVTEQIERDHPVLVREARIPVRTGDDRAIYSTDCEFYAFNSHVESWTATYTNPNAPYDRVLLWMRTVERAPRLTVVYRGGAGQAWADRPKPPGADPD